MIPFLIGGVCLLAALAFWRPSVPGRRALPWMLAVAVLGLTQLWIGAGRIDPYRITLMGFRFEMEGSGSDGACPFPCPTDLWVGGDQATADVWAPGAGVAPVGRLAAAPPATSGEQTRDVVTAHALEDGPSVLVTRTRGAGDSWLVVGSRPLEPGDRVSVLRGGEPWATLSIESRPDSLRLGKARVGLPWLRTDLLRVDAPGVVGVVVPLDGFTRRGMAGVGARRPSAFQRTYPLADVLEAAGAPSSGIALGSFFYYRDGELWFADQDSEVGSPDGEASRDTELGPGDRLMVAGLAHRDQPDSDLDLPARYGLRPLRTVVVTRDGRKLDVLLADPEVRSLSREWLDEAAVGLGSSLDAEYRIRIGGGGGTREVGDLPFRAVPARFGPASQALLALNRDPGTGAFNVTTPGGSGRWSTGRPVALGAGDRALLLRVDGQATGPGFWLVHALVFLLPLLLIGPGPRRGSVLALTVLAAGFAAVRLLLAWSAHVSAPFVAEGLQLALWLVPVLPVAVITAADLATWWSAPQAEGGARVASGRAVAPWSRAPADSPVVDPVPIQPSRSASAAAWVGWLALAVLTLGLFSQTPARAALLLGAVGVLCTGTLVPRLLTDRKVRWRPGGPSEWWGGPWAGPALGFAYLVVRMGMDLAGWREGIQVGATRVAVSAGYTPAVLAALAGLLVVHGRQVGTAREVRDLRRALANAAASLGGFVFLAVLCVSVWISDFGIALVGLPGILLTVSVLGAWWAAGRWRRPAIWRAAVLPLAVFVALQAVPSALSPLTGDVQPGSDWRLADWDRNELLLLERGDPEGLGMIGQRRSEALAVMRETMRSYTRGNTFGRGFLRGRVSSEIRTTAAREHVVSSLLASQWGLPGVLGLVLLLVGLMVPAVRALGPAPATGGRVYWIVGLFGLPVLLAATLPAPWGLLAIVACGTMVLADALRAGPDRASGGAAVASPSPARLPSWSTTTAVLFLFGLAGAGMYMVLANYGLVFFTGKNVYLLGLDSVSDVVEGTLLLAGAAWALSFRLSGPVRGPVVATPATLPQARPRRALSAVAGTTEVDR